MFNVLKTLNLNSAKRINFGNIKSSLIKPFMSFNYTNKNNLLNQKLGNNYNEYLFSSDNYLNNFDMLNIFGAKNIPVVSQTEDEDGDIYRITKYTKSASKTPAENIAKTTSTDTESKANEGAEKQGVKRRKTVPVTATKAVRKTKNSTGIKSAATKPSRTVEKNTEQSEDEEVEPKKRKVKTSPIQTNTNSAKRSKKNTDIENHTESEPETPVKKAASNRKITQVLVHETAPIKKTAVSKKEESVAPKRRNTKHTGEEKVAPKRRNTKSTEEEKVAPKRRNTKSTDEKKVAPIKKSSTINNKINTDNEPVAKKASPKKAQSSTRKAPTPDAKKTRRTKQ